MDCDSDNYFDEITPAFWQEFNDLEAKYAKDHPYTSTPTQPDQACTAILEMDDSDDYGSLDLDEEAFRSIDEITENALKCHSSISSSIKTDLPESNSRATTQTIPDRTILSKTLKDPSSSCQPAQRSSYNVFNGVVGPSRRTKQWDRTRFAKRFDCKKKKQTAQGN